MEMTRRTSGITFLARHVSLCLTANKSTCALKRKQSFTKQAVYKAGFPLVDFFRTNGLFSPLIHHITQSYQLLSRSLGEKKSRNTFYFLEAKKLANQSHC